MDLICYLQPGWAPLIRPAPATRPWMDDTPEAFAYRCLPLNIANAHGWEVLSPCGFEAIWQGGSDPGAVNICTDPGADPGRAPVSLFGQGVITFHIEGLFRTPPGWDLWVGGAPNRPKDGIQPLSGIVETDWSPFTFTMNWRFTRPGAWVRFEPMEPIAFFFPVERGAVEAFRPRFEPIDTDPASRDGFEAWSRAREVFHQRMQRETPGTPSEKWQKHYYRGVDVDGRPGADDHRAKLRLASFDTRAAPHVPTPPARDARSFARPPEPPSRLARDLAKREWLLEAAERQRALSPRASALDRVAGLSGEQFLDQYYAPCRPVILAREMIAWPALSTWSQDRFTAILGDDALTAAADDGFALGALGPLRADLGALDAFLAMDAGQARIRVRAAGHFSRLRHEPTNQFIAQISGRTRMLVGPASDIGRLYDDGVGLSEIGDLEDPDLDRARFSRLQGARIYALTLEPGDILFLPFAWWRQSRAIAFSISVTYDNFRWPNLAGETLPTE